MKRRIEREPRPSQAKLSLVGSSLPERMRAATFALLGLITAAGLSLVLLFAQTTLPIPSLGPVTGPLTGRQALKGGVGVATAGGASAGSVRGSSGSTGSLAVSTPTSAPAAVPVGSSGSSANGGPRGDGGLGSAAGEGTSISGNDPEVPAVQPQPTAVAPTNAPGSGADGGEEAPPATPVSTPVSTPPPAEPGIPTSEPPPVVEPEAPEPPLEEVPEGEPPEEPPVTEPPVEEDEEDGFLEATGPGRAAH